MTPLYTRWIAVCTSVAALTLVAGAQTAADPNSIHPIVLPAAHVSRAVAPGSAAAADGIAAGSAARVPEEIVPAEKVRPITTLPKPVSGPGVDEAASRGLVAPVSVPSETVRAITSLPKPVSGPGVDEAASRGLVAPVSVPAMAGGLVAPVMVPSAAGEAGGNGMLGGAVAGAGSPVRLMITVPGSAPMAGVAGTPGMDSGLGISASVLARVAGPRLRAAEAPAPVSLGDPALRASVTAAERPGEMMIARGLGPVRRPHVRPLRALAVQVRGGAPGIGADVSVPLLERVNVRAGYSYLKAGGDVTLDGIYLTGKLQFSSTNLSLDIFPFDSDWRISPGLALYRGNTIAATAVVPGGQTFTLNQVTLLSSPVDPVHGSAVLNFGWQKAPTLTIGRGNLIPRHGGHFSMPFEAGVQYIQRPTTTLALAGTACGNLSGYGACTSFQNDPGLQADVAAEEATMNYALRSMRIVPVVSVGIGWSFTVGRRASAIR